jgi:hypothetical protein
MPSIELQQIQASIPSSLSEEDPDKPSNRTSFDLASSAGGQDHATEPFSPIRGDITSGEEPYHVFTPGMKAFIVFNASAVAALSGLSSNIYFPAQQDISVVCTRDLFLPRGSTTLLLQSH